MEIIIHGAAGKMGHMVAERAAAGFCGAHTAAMIDPGLPEGAAEGWYSSLNEYDGPADAVLDFSHHSAVGELLDYCEKRSLPVVIATTGHTEDERMRIAAAAEQIPVFLAPNMALGVAVLADLVRRAAAAFPGADIEIVETHHNQKLDVPSGTALLLASAVREVRPAAENLVGRHENGKRRPEEIGIHSLRLGSEVGTHEVLISTATETLTLTHRTHSRAVFAEGALSAAAFLLGKKPGLYTMKDLIGETSA